MVGARLIGVWAAVALAASAFAGGAARAEQQPGAAVALELEGTHGYSLMVLAGARAGKSRGQIVVFVDSPHSRVTYQGPATVTPTSLAADLGGVVHISLQFEPSGVKRTARDCERQPVEFEGGSWVGQFEVRGEEGFTEVSSTRLPYTLQPFLRLVCGGTLSEFYVGGDGIEGAGLRIGSRGTRPAIELSARTNGPGKAVEFFASIREQRGEVEIERAVGGRMPHSVFGYDPHLAWATLQPPAPFNGRGVFRRAAPRAERWSGNLQVDFPGRADVPVTGARFRPVLRHGEWRRSEHPGRARLAMPTLPPWPSTKR